jgi:sterol desaturase/sphingolipid hydroxylase (fatty acid hydroxylase superfamily)
MSSKPMLHNLMSLGAAIVHQATALLLSPGSSFSLLSLIVALCIAMALLARRRLVRGRRLRGAVLLRALFPRKLAADRSVRADLGFLAFNVFAFGLLFSWSMLSYGAVAHWTQDSLTATFGAPRRHVPAPLAGAILTVAMFLAYEFGFWADHYLSHRIPFFWEFHRVHHTATTLTPLTNFRVHPIEGIKFANILALSLGLTFAVVQQLLGGDVKAFEFAGRNLLLLGFVLLLIHLQHTHLWIAFTGRLGRLLISPAHHQIHHSADPAHFGCNLGSYLAIFDWLFGTLRIPAAINERLRFGAPSGSNPHAVNGAIFAPFGLALRSVLPSGFLVHKNKGIWR